MSSSSEAAGAAAAVAVADPRNHPIRLSGHLTYADITRRRRDGAVEVVEGRVRASEPVDGVRWLSLQDSITMLTGKSVSAAQMQIARELGKKNRSNFLWGRCRMRTRCYSYG
jgi:hypothetical protein